MIAFAAENFQTYTKIEYNTALDSYHHTLAIITSWPILSHFYSPSPFLSPTYLPIPDWFNLRSSSPSGLI